MSLTFACGHCGRHCNIDGVFVGKQGRCDQCGSELQVPDLGPSETPRGRVPGREPSPSRGALARAGVLAPHGFEVDDEPSIRPSDVMDLGGDDLEPIGSRRVPSGPAGPFAPLDGWGVGKESRSSKGRPATLVGLILLGFAIGSAGIYASLGVVRRLQQDVIPGQQTRSVAEALILERISLNQGLSAMLGKIGDVPTAASASAEVNRKVRALSANFRELRANVSLKSDADALNRKYEARMTQATNQLLDAFGKLAQDHPIWNSLRVNDALKELAREEMAYLAGRPKRSDPAGTSLAHPAQSPGDLPDIMRSQRPAFHGVQGRWDRPNRGEVKGPDSGPG